MGLGIPLRNEIIATASGKIVIGQPELCTWEIGEPRHWYTYREGRMHRILVIGTTATF